jgi:hypothetical protein
MQAFASALRKKNVFLAYFKKGDDWFQFPDLEEIKALIPLRVLAETEDGTLFAATNR